jgi:hypothetical protein
MPSEEKNSLTTGSRVLSVGRFLPKVHFTLALLNRESVRHRSVACKRCSRLYRSSCSAGVRISKVSYPQHSLKDETLLGPDLSISRLVREFRPVASSSAAEHDANCTASSRNSVARGAAPDRRDRTEPQLRLHLSPAQRCHSSSNRRRSSATSARRCSRSSPEH